MRRSSNDKEKSSSVKLKVQTQRLKDSSVRTRAKASQSICVTFQSLRQLQTKRLNELIVNSRIWDQFNQKFLHKARVISNDEKLFVTLKFWNIQINHEHLFATKKNKERRQIYIQTCIIEKLFSRKIEINSNWTKEAN